MSKHLFVFLWVVYETHLGENLVENSTSKDCPKMLAPRPQWEEKLSTHSIEFDLSKPQEANVCKINGFA